MKSFLTKLTRSKHSVPHGAVQCAVKIAYNNIAEFDG